MKKPNPSLDQTHYKFFCFPQFKTAFNSAPLLFLLLNLAVRWDVFLEALNPKRVKRLVQFSDFRLKI